MRSSPNQTKSILHESKSLLMLAWPIMIAQLAQNTMGFVDTLMSARAGSEDLAAIALGSSLWLPIFLALAGILMATTPIVAHHVGAQNNKQIRSIFYQGIWVALFLGAVSVILLQNTSFILSRLSLEPSLQAKTEGYLAAISWGFPALLLLQVIRGFSEGHGRTKAVMKIALLGLLCNIPLNYIFIFGKLGLPALGGVGCGIASAIVMWIMLFAGIIYLNKSKFFAHLSLSFKWQAPIPSQLITFLKLGTPIGFALLIESSMFSVIALLIAPHGETVIAANQITISFTGLIFMIPLSIAMALTIRVGQLAGANQILEARKAAFTGIYLTLVIAFFTCLFIFLFVHSIVGLYTSETNIVSLASQLLLIAALFQFSDAIQVSAAGALRGYKDTAVPLLLVFVSFWIIGLPSGYILGLTDIILPAQGAAGFWYGLLIGLSFGAVMLLSRLHRVSKHEYQSR